MSRYRLNPTPAQEVILRRHCTHARYVWNLAVEQQSWWRPGRSHAPGYCAQAAQLTQARAAFDWLAAGSHMVQQQALRDFAQAMTSYLAGTHGKPTWRKEGRHEGFRIVAVMPGHVRRLSPQDRRGPDPQSGLGAVSLVSSRPRSQVLPSHPRSRRAMAHRLRRHPPAHPRSRNRPGRRHRPRRDRLGGTFHRRPAALPYLTPRRASTASAVAAQVCPCPKGLTPTPPR